MTNPVFYTEDFQGQSGQTARAEQVASEFDSVANGFELVSSYVVRAIVGATGETLTPLPAVAGRKNLWLKFDANGNPVVVPSPFNARGAWAAATAYAVGDAYTSSPNSTLYYVKTAYTSGSTFGSTDTANTLILFNAAGLFFASYQIETASFPAAAGSSYGVDSTSGSMVITLPTGNLGDSPINITHVGGSLTGSQTITINPAAGQYIMGSSSTGGSSLVLDVINASISFSYLGPSYGWRLRTMG